MLTAALLQPKPVQTPHCYLCGNGEGVTFHAPCILSLSNGQISELRIYELKDGDYAQVETTEEPGYVSFSSSRDGSVSYQTVGETTTATIRKDNGGIDESLFCESCRGLIQEALTGGADGPVLVDVLDLDDIKVYPLTETTYTIRDYTIDLFENESSFAATITAHLYE